MALQLYEMTDAGAPGASSDLITILDAVLVNGYGSKAPAGWTKPFSDTNKAVYQMPATAPRQLYLRVDQTTNKWLGYLTMSDVDTGTIPFPPNSTQYVARGPTYEHWFILADDKTILYCSKIGGVKRFYYFGYLRDEIPGDINHAVCIGSQGSTTGIYNLVGTYYANSINLSGAALVFSGILGPYATSGDPGTALYGNTIGPSGTGTNSQYDFQNMNSLPGFPDTNGNYHLERFIHAEAGDVNTARIYRGRLRGIAWPYARQSTMVDQATIPGTGDYSGLTIRVEKFVKAQLANTTTLGEPSPFTLCILIGD